MKHAILSTLAASLMAASLAAQADITIGVVGSFTGPAAAIGTEIRKAAELIPGEFNGEKINVIALDDATDPTTAVRNTSKLISENKVDVIIGPVVVALASAMAEPVSTGKTPLIVVAPYVPPPNYQPWVFPAVQSAGLMIQRIVDDMVERKIRTVGYIGFADAWGDLAFNEFKKAVAKTDIRIVAEERYKRPDTTVTAQVLKLTAANPDAIFIGASGTPATTPQLELKQRGYGGPIYQTHGVSTKDFIRVGGKSVEGTLIPVGPMLVAEQLPDDHPAKGVAVEFNQAFEAKNGENSRSTLAGAAWDGWLLVRNALPAALKAAQPGTVAFREALRAELEKTHGLAGTHGVYDMSAEDHTGLDDRARVLITIENGEWKLVK